MIATSWEGAQMAEQHERNHDHAAEVTQHNVEQMRELLARKHQQEHERGSEPPLEGDPNVASQQNPQAQDPTASPGKAGGIRNMGGGRS
jgi:hypothetical protein